MVGFQLLLPLSVLIPGAAFSRDVIEERCTRQSKSAFCVFLKRAQGLDRDALKRLNGDLAGEGKRKLTEAYEMVTEVVRNTREASYRLMTAFNVEASALTLVGKDCSNLYKTLYNQTERQEGLIETCRDVSNNIRNSMVNIIYAVIETQTDPMMREATKQAFESFQHVLSPW